MSEEIKVVVVNLIEIKHSEGPGSDLTEVVGDESFCLRGADYDAAVSALKQAGFEPVRNLVNELERERERRKGRD